MSLGSYPVTEEADGCRIVIFIEGKNPRLVRDAAAAMASRLAPGCVVSESSDVDGLLSPRRAPGAAAAKAE